MILNRFMNLFLNKIQAFSKFCIEDYSFEQLNKHLKHFPDSEKWILNHYSIFRDTKDKNFHKRQPITKFIFWKKSCGFYWKTSLINHIILKQWKRLINLWMPLKKIFLASPPLKGYYHFTKWNELLKMELLKYSSLPKCSPNFNKNFWNYMKKSKSQISVESIWILTERIFSKYDFYLGLNILKKASSALFWILLIPE